ncbi:MAG: serine hydrolase domain-containing protein [Planctomycetota bacterium]
MCLHGPLSFSIGQDFAALTALAEGALVGANVDEAVPGFEIRLLKSGQVLYHQAFGEWSLDRPARADSSTKTLSGALMMSLAETAESGFALDSELSEFLAEYDQAGLRDITVRQAFSHTAGFEGQDATSLILAAPNITLRRAAELISTKTLINGPAGSTFAYGGLSMHAAGAAAEVATGQSYVAFFAERISTPLGLTDTQFVTASDSNPRVAGGAQSTATDFAKFMDMLLNGGIDRATGTRILQETSVEEMLTRQTTDAQPIANSPLDNSRYGIGVWLDQLTQVGPGVDALAGGARGFHSWIDASHDLVFAFATDLTTIANVEVLSSTMHQVILEAIAEPGDFNLDGQVDGADYLNWQMDERSAVDLLSWQANYGSSVTTFLVPEPSTGLLILGGIMAFVTLCQYLVRRD